MFFSDAQFENCIMKTRTFKKSERLSKKKLVKELFDKGSSFYLYPFKVIHHVSEEQIEAHQVLISASKRNFKKAVDRNKIKRRVRESYRLNKTSLSIQQNLLIAYIYTSKEILPYDKIQKKLVLCIERLNKHYEEK